MPAEDYNQAVADTVADAPERPVMVTYLTAAGGKRRETAPQLHQGTVQAGGPICWSVNRTMQLNYGWS